MLKSSIYFAAILVLAVAGSTTISVDPARAQQPAADRGSPAAAIRDHAEISEEAHAILEEKIDVIPPGHTLAEIFAALAESLFRADNPRSFCPCNILGASALPGWGDTQDCEANGSVGSANNQLVVKKFNAVFPRAEVTEMDDLITCNVIDSFVTVIEDGNPAPGSQLADCRAQIDQLAINFGIGGGCTLLP